MNENRQAYQILNLFLLFITTVINIILIYIFMFCFNNIVILHFTIIPKYLVFLPFIFVSLLFVLFLYSESVFLFFGIIFICLSGYFLYETYTHYDIYVHNGFTILSINFHFKYSFKVRSNYIIDVLGNFNVEIVNQIGIHPILLSLSDLGSLLEIESKDLLDKAIAAIITDYLSQVKEIYEIYQMNPILVYQRYTCNVIFALAVVGYCLHKIIHQGPLLF